MQSLTFELFFFPRSLDYLSAKSVEKGSGPACPLERSAESMAEIKSSTEQRRSMSAQAGFFFLVHDLFLISAKVSSVRHTRCDKEGGGGGGE